MNILVAEPAAVGITVADPVRHSEERLLWLDCLRGFAVLGVILVHVGQRSGFTPGKFVRICTDAGQFGVQLFFVVSAITIGLTYESHVRKFGGGVRSNLAWLAKRFFRIAPLYYVAAFFFAAEELLRVRFGLPIPHHDANLRDLIANLLFIQTWVTALPHLPKRQPTHTETL